MPRAREPASDTFRVQSPDWPMGERGDTATCAGLLPFFHASDPGSKSTLSPARPLARSLTPIDQSIPIDATPSLSSPSNWRIEPV